MVDIPEFDISELGSFIRRRVLWILIPLLLGCGVALLLLRLTPRTYQATTLILVEGQKVPENYVRSTVTSRIDQRLKSLRQQVTNRESLEKIIEEANLYPEMRNEVSLDALIAKAKRDLSVRVLPGQLFEISFRGSDPVAVAFTANRIADLFIEENLRLRARDAANTSEFLSSELEETREILEQKEGELVEFRLKNEGVLPEQRQANFNAIEQLQTKLQINQTEIEQAELRKTLLQRDRDKESSAQDIAGSAEPSRLDELNQELTALKAKFTPNHPDVIRKQAEIDQILAQHPIMVEDTGSRGEAIELNPIMQAELEKADASLTRLRNERDRLLGQIAVYQQRIEMTPRIEQQLTSLTRDYENFRESFESLLNKRIEARLAEDLERKQQSEQFRKLEEARPPTTPISPNPPFYYLVGSLFGAVLGVGLALVRDRTDATLDAEDAVKKAFPGLSYVISIPHLSVPTDAAEPTEMTNSANTA